MEDIVEIAKFLTKQRAKKIDLLYHYPKDRPDKYTSVAAHMAEDRIKTDQEMAEAINASKDSGKYWMFKKRFKEKLLNSMLFLDLNEENSNPYGRALKTCSRNIYCVNLLLLYSASRAATELAEYTLRLALEFEIYDCALFCSKILRKQHSYYGNKARFEHYNELVEKYHTLAYANDKATEYLESLNVIQVNTNIIKPDILKSALEYLGQIKNLFETHPTYQVGLHYYRVKAVYECMVPDYEAALNTWIGYEKFLSGYTNFEYRIRLGESALQQLYCHLCLGDYKSGEICAENCEKLFKLHSNNWFIYKEYFFLLAMHTRNYEAAGATVRNITSIPHFKFLNRNRQEKWKIFEAYHYLMLKSQEKNIDGDKSDKKFRLSRFLNEIPIYNKDKEGFNTSILVIQVLILLLDGEFGKLFDKMEALKRYANRYFIKDAVYKSRIFIKMLLIADKNGYKKAATTLKTAELLQRLKTSGYTHVNTYDGLEIVPYSDLWQIVTENLVD